MSLPKKTERTIEVEFTQEEEVQYLQLEQAAKTFFATSANSFPFL